MALFVNGILCQEIVRQYEESADWDKGPMGTKGFLCRWIDRFTVANGLLGLATATTVGGVITLNLPMKHPELNSAYVRAIEIEPKGPPIQGPVQLAFSNCIIWAHYGCIPWSFSGINLGNIDPATPLIYAKQNINIVTEVKTIPGAKAYFQSLNKPTGMDYGFPVCIVEMEITFMHVPYLPSQQVLQLSQNPINEVTFLGCAPGTVFFLGMKSDQSFDTSGSFDQNLTMAFKYRPIAPWDQDWNGTAWDTVLGSQGGDPLIGRSDLNQLIPGGYLA